MIDHALLLARSFAEILILAGVWLLIWGLADWAKGKAK